MTAVCRVCARVNPAEARYCYHDGVALPGLGPGGGPVAVGSQPFHSPFVFPSGRHCGNFDELVLACDNEWRAAQELLKQGYLETFLGGVGRTDLALAARQAAQAPDADRALEELIAKLPGSGREPARLDVQPAVIELGRVERGSDRTLTLRLENQGAGLLYGSVACEKTPWLALGEAPGAPEKVFQCRHALTLPVQVLGKALRAADRPLEGQVVIDSNGGTATVVVRAEVPVRPYPDGALAGARTPRQLAEKARLNPRGAASQFESGAVTAWYEANGWTYPVQGPASSGLGAVQQFFEALGLVKPPRVEIRERVVALHGRPGEALEHWLELRTEERRHVFAHGGSSEPWLRVGPAELSGPMARLPLRVAVPDQPGQRLRAEVHLAANGSQRFTVEVFLVVTAPQPVLPPNRQHAFPVAQLAGALAPDGTVAGIPLAEAAPVATAAPPALWVGRPQPATPPPVPPPPPPEEDGPPPEVGRRRSGALARLLKHLLPLGLLTLALLGVLLHDYRLPVERDEEGEPVQEVGAALLDERPRIAVHFHDGSEAKIRREPKTMRFGLEMLGEPDPKNPDLFKRLTFDRWGRTNNTCVRIDGREALFGHDLRGKPRGRWVEREAPLGQDASGRERQGLRSTWLWPDSNIRLTQQVEVVPGSQSRLLDTCLVRYTLENADSEPHDVGVRFMLDTFIGANDGVPFYVPGRSEPCNTQLRFDRPDEVPDFIQALENDTGDLSNPGTVATLQFRVGQGLEAPERVTLGGWPNERLREFGVTQAAGLSTLWEVPVVPMKELVRLAQGRWTNAEPDSAVAIYWGPKTLPPGGRRDVGFTYGLGKVAAEGQGKLLLSVGGQTQRDGEFTLTALVHRPEEGERLTLRLPKSFKLLGGSVEEPVPPAAAGAARPVSTVSWRLKARRAGQFELEVRSSTGAKQALPLRITEPPPRGVLD
jgi:hypothetical protein